MAAGQGDLQRVWLRQLLMEHQQICWRHGVALRPPVFEISEDGRRAGTWSADFAGLAIAGWLIRSHGWQVVLEVLRHEMAHQYVHQVMGRGLETPHGPAFQEACCKLGVHHRFRGASGPMGGDAPPGAVLAKVEKLLCLAGSANEHEAALAMEKANDLLRKHNISRLEQGGATEYDYLISQGHAKRISAVQRAMAALLNDFFYVQVVFNHQFDAASGQTWRVMELLGAVENLAVAEHVHVFLSRRLDILWQHYRAAQQCTGHEKRSYQLGVLKGFRARLQGQERRVLTAPGAKSTALIRCEDQGLSRFCRLRHPRLQSVRRRGARVFRGAYQAGEEEGQRLIIHKTVTTRGTAGGLLPAVEAE
jgi:hypothetical protein